MREVMNRFKKIISRLFIITITIIVVTTIPILVNDERIIMAQQGGPGVTPIEPKNVTNQTLQGYPTEDKDMSVGLENK
jgi:hypothetical protein